jgi:hypothetical protein
MSASEPAERRARASFRAFLLDARGDGQYLRATWHPNGRLFVLSHWQDDVCVAATRIDVAEAGELISLLAAGLADAATVATPPAPGRVESAVIPWRAPNGGDGANRQGRRPAR